MYEYVEAAFNEGFYKNYITKKFMKQEPGDLFNIQ